MKLRYAAIALAAATLLLGAPRADAEPIRDIGGQYGWANPSDFPTGRPFRIQTQGRCGNPNGQGGQMRLVGEDGVQHYGTVTVPQEWVFEQGYGFSTGGELPVGNYDIAVDCGDMWAIHIAISVTPAGTEPFYPPYENTKRQDPPPTPPTTAAPAQEPDEVSVDEHSPAPQTPPGPAAGRSARTRPTTALPQQDSAPVVEMLADHDVTVPTTTFEPTANPPERTPESAPPRQAMLVNTRAKEPNRALAIGATAGALVAVGAWFAVRRTRRGVTPSM